MSWENCYSLKALTWTFDFPHKLVDIMCFYGASFSCPKCMQMHEDALLSLTSQIDE